jgi:putative membrane protein
VEANQLLWIKTLHIVFVASWFAGLFYLPRIFVNLAMLEEDEEAVWARLILMANKLMRFTTILMFFAVLMGAILWLYYGVGLGSEQTWMHAKLTLVLAVVVFHVLCFRHLQTLRAGVSERSHIWYRWFNELPVILMLLIVALVVHKPQDPVTFLIQAFLWLLGLVLLFVAILSAKKHMT